MLDKFAAILANPLNQILLGVPLSVFANFSSDTLKALFSSFSDRGHLQNLEETLFKSFLKALEIHQSRYDRIARDESKKLQNIARNKKNEFIQALKDFNYQEEYHLPTNLDEGDIRQLLAEKIFEVFQEDIPEEKVELVIAITRDTCRFYREAFFEKVSQENQLWIVFNEALKISSIVEIVKEIQQKLPTREEFEVIRYYILKNQATPDLAKLKDDYLKYLEIKFSSIELTGISPRVFGQDISFKLEDIFIPFNIGKNNLTQNTLAINNQDKEKYRELFKENDPLISDKINLLKNLEIFPQIVLLGDPGGGKTTLLKYITYLMSKSQRREAFLPFYLPIFLRISEYAKVLKTNPSKRLLDFLLNDYDKDFADLYRWAFENCQALLLLDGLDEVLDVSQRLKVVEEVQDTVARRPENRYILTSRIIGYDSARLGCKFQHFTIEKFNRNQIGVFCRSWYKAVAQNKNNLSNAKFSELELEAEKLYKTIISKKAIEDLACNPLMVTLIANIHFKGQSLPYSRVQLYDIATETLLQYWVQRRVADEGELKDKDDIIEILSPVSFYIHKNNPEGLIAEKDFYEQCRVVLKREEYDLSPKDIKREIRELIKFLQQQSGFFHEKGRDESTGDSLFGFLHQTFQEYFTAIEIVNQWKENVINFDDLLENLRWTESLRLAAGILNTEKGRSRKTSTTQFVNDILNLGADENINIRAVLLVALILVDNIDLTPQAQDDFFNRLFNVWSNSPDNDVREIEKHIAFLLQSKHQDSILTKIKSIIELDRHPLHSKIPGFIRQHCLSIQEFKGYFVELLTSQKSQLCLSAWKALKKYIYDLDMTVYYEAQQSAYLSYDPALAAENLLGYSAFLEKIQLMPESVFSELVEVLVKALDSYLWLYFSPDGYQSYSTKDLISESRKNESERARILFFSLLAKHSSNLLSFENEIEEMINGLESKSELLKEAENLVKNQISKLKNKDKSNAETTKNLQQL